MIAYYIFILIVFILFIFYFFTNIKPKKNKKCYKQYYFLEVKDEEVLRVKTNSTDKLNVNLEHNLSTLNYINLLEARYQNQNNYEQLAEVLEVKSEVEAKVINIISEIDLQ